MTATLSAVARRARERAEAAPGGLLDQALAANPPPAELAYLAERIGARATLALIEAEGGHPLHIPKSANQGSKLARLIGLEPARALVAWRGGEYVKIPLARHWRIRIRRSMGATYRQIARDLGITEKAVHDNLHAARLTHPQPDLFG
jgi:hypothetical protein